MFIHNIDPVIFSIAIFVGLLSLVFFFTWYRQSKVTRVIITDARQTSFGKEDDEETSG